MDVQQHVMADSTGGGLSGDFDGVDGNDLWQSRTTTGTGSNYAASGNDLESMINDILTY
jgi:hypothetical protein